MRLRSIRGVLARLPAKGNTPSAKLVRRRHGGGRCSPRPGDDGVAQAWRLRKARVFALDRQSGLRDQLNEPLGMDSDPFAQAPSAGWAFLVAAALVALAVGLGEEYLLLGLKPHGGAGLAAGSMAQAAAPSSLPPLRLVAAPANPPQVTEPVKMLAPPGSTGAVRGRSGAPEPLIIDVQQALARLRAQDPFAAER